MNLNLVQTAFLLNHGNDYNGKILYCFGLILMTFNNFVRNTPKNKPVR